MGSRFVSIIALLACLAPATAMPSTVTAVSAESPSSTELFAESSNPNGPGTVSRPRPERRDTRQPSATAGPSTMFRAVGPVPERGAPRDERPILVTGRIRVIDGDTFAIGHQRFRLRGVDTPERGQAKSLTAKRRLEALLQAGPVTMVRHGTDVYGRTLVDVYVGGRDVAQILRRDGFDTRHPVPPVQTPRDPHALFR